MWLFFWLLIHFFWLLIEHLAYFFGCSFFVWNFFSIKKKRSNIFILDFYLQDYVLLSFTFPHQKINGKSIFKQIFSCEVFEKFDLTFDYRGRSRLLRLCSMRQEFRTEEGQTLATRLRGRAAWKLAFLSFCCGAMCHSESLCLYMSVCLSLSLSVWSLSVCGLSLSVK